MAPSHSVPHPSLSGRPRSLRLLLLLVFPNPIRHRLGDLRPVAQCSVGRREVGFPLAWLAVASPLAHSDLQRLERLRLVHFHLLCFLFRLIVLLQHSNLFSHLKLQGPLAPVLFHCSSYLMTYADEACSL